MVTRNIKLKQLNLNPLSVAKYFWEKGVEDMALSQRLIYLSYLEALKDNYLLFEEEWQAWPRGPVVKSVADKMFDNYDKLGKLFSKAEDLDNELVLNYADKIFKKHHSTEPYILSRKAQNKPWKDARKPLSSEREIAIIPSDSLIKFTNGKHIRTIV